MALIHSSSQPSFGGQVDLFSSLRTDTTTQSSLYTQYKPTINVQDSDSKLEFKMIGSASQYLNLEDSFLHLKVKLVTADGQDIPAGEDLSCTNYLLHTMFSQCDVFINNQLISTTDNCYGFKAYFEAMFSYNNEYFDTQGRCAMFYKDTKGGILDDVNIGYANRKIVLNASSVVEMIDKLKFDLSKQMSNRLILSDTNISIVLTRAPDSFALLSKKPSSLKLADGSVFVPKLKIMDATFHVRKEVLYPSIIVSHQKLLEKGEVAKYFCKRSEMKYFTIPAGNQSFIEENVFVSKIPNKVILALVPSKAFNGNFACN